MSAFLVYSVLTASLSLLATARAAEPVPPEPSGAAIYRNSCARCHGSAGEGVKGKYDEALSGDWSLEKLTRIIEKTMPEDEPGTCVGPDAQAVARYIHDEFYSREARARKSPARVELSRLTNRQYANTVADLLKSFTGKDDAPGEERGLRATYYSSRNMSREGFFHRTDPEIDFFWGEESPRGTLTNEFAVQWRGSLLAEESGVYEFIVRTPIGVRLWVNDDENPLVDAWVSSDETEYRGSVRLIGGRAYPLRLDCFKFKEKTSYVTLLWKPPHGAEQVIPERNLTPARARPTFVVSTAFPPDDSSVGYERGVAVSKAWDEASVQAALEVANHVLQQLDRFSDSKPQDTNRAEKVEAFCARLMEAAFRRPLSAEQQEAFVSAQFKSAPNVEDAVRRVVLLALMSPRFRYLGLDRAQTNEYETASRLSYALWDSMPNEELMKAAREEKLRSREQIEAQARRMLADSRARAKMRAFLEHWLQMNHVEDFSKDASLFPGFTPEIVADLRASLGLFLDEVVWSEDSDYRKLLQADYVYLNSRLAGYYGIDACATNGFVKAPFDASGRAGVVTHPYLLSAFSYNKSTSPIHRGVFLTRNIVGRALKAPPVAVAFNDAEFSPHLTMREKVTELTRAQACQTCHSVINPLGFSLEHYDAVGRYRAEEQGKAIDSVSEYLTDDGKAVRLASGRDVAAFAIQSDHAHRAFVEQLFHHLVKQPALAYGPDVLERLRQSFAESGFNIQKLAVEIATLSALHGPKKSS